MKKIFLFFLVVVLTFSGTSVLADEADETYELIFEEDGSEIDNLFDGGENMVMPRSRYIMSAYTTIKYLGSNKVGIHVDVYCNQTVKSISSVFILQKWSGSTWKDIASGTISVSGTSSLSKTGTVSGLPSGTYRAKSVSKVIDYSGYSETITGYSGSISF